MAFEVFEKPSCVGKGAFCLLSDQTSLTMSPRSLLTLFGTLLLFATCAPADPHTPTAVVAIDFGSTPTPFPWNNVTSPAIGAPLNLTSMAGAPTGMRISVVDAFGDNNNSGTLSPHPEIGLPSTASCDGFWGNQVENSGVLEPAGAVRLDGMDPLRTYTLTLFSSRLAEDNRETEFRLQAARPDTLRLNAADNASEIVTFVSAPLADGSMIIEATTGPGNNNPSGLFYLGALIISSPGDNLGAGEVHLSEPAGGEFWQVGAAVDVEWTATTGLPVELSLSEDDGETWSPIATVPATAQSFRWIAQDQNSNKARIRAVSGSAMDVTDAPFTLSHSSALHPIVVIGSSTAAGAGASIPDSAWVARYRAEVYANDTRIPVINLARGGYTTCQLLPDDCPLARVCGPAIDPERNISMALSLNPAAVIVNLPSNDAAKLFSLDQTMDNFEAIVVAAEEVGVPVWVATTQPRNGFTTAQIDLQLTTRQAIEDAFLDRAIDFWTGFSNAEHGVLPSLDSGDGVHLNDAGHAMLFDRVLAAGIPGVACGANADRGAEAQGVVQHKPNPLQPSQPCIISLPNGASCCRWRWVDDRGMVLSTGESADIENGSQFSIDAPETLTTSVRFLFVQSRSGTDEAWQSLKTLRVMQEGREW